MSNELGVHASQVRLGGQPMREVRVERWVGRLFYATPCRFFIDVPLDMSGCVAAALRDAVAAGCRLAEDGEVLATDSIFRGAILVEVEPIDSVNLVVLDTEVLARGLPEKGVRLRKELDELVRWAIDLGHDVAALYVRFEPTGTIPGAMKPTHVYAAIQGGDHVTEPPPPATSSSVPPAP